MKPIPTRIGRARVVRWTAIDVRHEPTEACRHSIGSEEMPAASRLAICRYDNGPGFYLFYCDDAWNEIADTWHETLEAAMAQAEFEYTGSPPRGRSSNHPARADRWLAFARRGRSAGAFGV